MMIDFLETLRTSVPWVLQLCPTESGLVISSSKAGPPIQMKHLSTGVPRSKEDTTPRTLP